MYSLPQESSIYLNETLKIDKKEHKFLESDRKKQEPERLKELLRRKKLREEFVSLLKDPPKWLEDPLFRELCPKGNLVMVYNMVLIDL